MSETYLSAAEAARVLGVSRQRVNKMAEDGDVIALRPWPGAVRIPESSVQDYANGIRRPSLSRTAALDYLMNAGVTDIYADPAATERALYEYIIGSRPEWDGERYDAWVTKMQEAFAEASER